uniref:Uncharacterized protein n=1 Tax=Anguilla anguilla TaxID=7936 RepID=A0A0E9PMQ4_ANGAN
MCAVVPADLTLQREEVVCLSLHCISSAPIKPKCIKVKLSLRISQTAARLSCALLRQKQESKATSWLQVLICSSLYAFGVVQCQPSLRHTLISTLRKKQLSAASIFGALFD